MRIVATSDTHFPFDASRVPDGDVFILAGDFMYEGTPAEWEPRLESLAALPHKRKIYVPGNHDYFPFHYRGLARSQLRREANVTLVDDYEPQFEIDGVSFLAIPFVTGLPGWAYNREEPQVYQWLRDTTEGFHPDVIISHSQPYRNLDACGTKPVNHYGCMAFNKWFFEPGRKPTTWICGHIHDSYGHERIEGCDFYNVAMCDEKYQQTNPPMVIDL